MKNIIAAIAIALSLASIPAMAVEAPTEWYSVTKPAPGSSGPGNVNVNVQSHKGSWWGPMLSEQPGLTMPAGTTTMGMRFEFQTDSYFTAGNSGHIAIGLRGDGFSGLLGRGIIIGNVTGLQGDSATTNPAAIAIESFWADGNAVYGKATESTPMENNTHYRVTIVSSGVNAETIAYTLEKKVDIHWVKVAHHEIIDHKGAGKVSPNLGGWFIVEVFSQHAWSYQLKNMNVWYE